MGGLTRRQFGFAAAAVGLLGIDALAQPSTPSVQLPDGSRAPALGQGSWHLAAGRHPAAEEEDALRTGISLGLTLLDTAEVYGDGRAERMIGRVIAGQREKVFLVSKVAPYHATATGIREACTGSLVRLGTDYLDVYLLHWRDGVSDLGVVVHTFESLRAEGRIRRWGVSNFAVADMEDLYRVPGGAACATNQVRYNLLDRSIERDLLPWCDQHRVPIMAYSPLGRGGDLLRNPALARVADRHQSSPAAVALAWTLRGGRVIAIPESGSPAHVRQNAAALSLQLTDLDLDDLNRA
ncbi:MAG TPA: aldo/keto reductase [Candidatus Sulfotelmatobacter sp.]|nr:aldo/keto reductase [Candidatus Sulfotelmatobacter sp.]